MQLFFCEYNLRDGTSKQRHVFGLDGLKDQLRFANEDGAILIRCSRVTSILDPLMDLDFRQRDYADGLNRSANA